MENLEGFIDGVEILGLVIVLDGDHLEVEIDLGTLTLSLENREFKMDVKNSYRTPMEGYTTIRVDLTTVDEDGIFPDCPFNISALDLMSKNLKAVLFYSSEVEWEYCTLFLKYQGLTRAINVEVD